MPQASGSAAMLTVRAHRTLRTPSSGPQARGTIPHVCQLGVAAPARAVRLAQCGGGVGNASAGRRAGKGHRDAWRAASWRNTPATGHRRIISDHAASAEPI
ncbi:hypothetical protein WOLCODRAFT_164172 [Wolfiporia cocos MD-104 SS10]|uniref:Uncharacterized protein n=1 Tax=Wolfiporia cocos (strain MD-104) TaxID=742152 RepID=A0A2H3K3M2_WOLCO|nr:hypothetical protein WOLCODRAFT_164172 [Wolfiporia cocos MD-104 SS10]